jgi:hypothetical protein
MTSETRTDDGPPHSTLAVRAGVVLRFHAVPSARLGSVSPRQSHEMRVLLCHDNLSLACVVDSFGGPMLSRANAGCRLAKVVFGIATNVLVAMKRS